MADNVIIPASGTGDATPTIAADDVGGAKYQRVKISVGADGVVGDATPANPLPVDDADSQVLYGAVNETPPATDTASSGLNGRLQRVAQRITSLIALLPASLGQKTSAASLAVTVASDQSTLNVAQTGALPAGTNNIGDVDVLTLPSLPAGANAIGKLAANSGVDIGDVDVTSSALPTGASTEATLSAQSTLMGAVTETAPATDTASSGANGRLQRVAQRLTSLLAVLPTALGQTTKAGSLSVTLASNQDALPITDNAGSITVDGTVTTTPPANASTNVAQIAGTTTDTNSGTKSAGTQRVVLATDQPALTNALKVDGSAVTQPVSGTVTTTPPANASENIAQINGVTPLMGTGNTGTGSLRVTLATDQVALTNALKVDPSAVTSPVSLASVPSHAVTNAGTFAVQAAPRVATTATLTNTAASASNVANLVALNTNRLGLTIFNDSSATLMLKYGTTASATSFTYEIPPLSQWEMPVDPLYTGRIDAIWTAATGNARITELSA